MSTFAHPIAIGDAIAIGEEGSGHTITNETLVTEGNVRRGGTITLVVGDDFDTVILPVQSVQRPCYLSLIQSSSVAKGHLPNGDTRVGRAQVNTDSLDHFADYLYVYEKRKEVVVVVSTKRLAVELCMRWVCMQKNMQTMNEKKNQL